MEGSGEDPSNGQNTDKEKPDNPVKCDDVFARPSGETGDSQPVGGSTEGSGIPSSTDPGEWVFEQEGSNQKIRHSSGNTSVSGVVLRSSTSSTGSQTDMSRPASIDTRLAQSDILRTSTSGNSLTQSDNTTTDTGTLQSHNSEPDVRPRTRDSSIHQSSQSHHTALDEQLPNVSMRRPKSAVRSRTQTFTEREEPNERRFSGTLITPRPRNRSSTGTENVAELTPVYGIPGRSPREINEQGEEVLRNYMYATYNRDLERSEGEMIPSPQILNNFSPEPASHGAQVGRQLADIGDRINDQYSSEFRQMSRLLNIQAGSDVKEAMYDVFRDVCSRLFTHGINWGRIVALIQFGYYMAMSYLRTGIGDFMSSIICHLLRFMAEQKIVDTIRNLKLTISEWIASQGGWQAALTEVRNSVNPYYAAATIVLSVSLLAGLYFWYKQ